jgi:mRNA interferase RelE/StbE
LAYRIEFTPRAVRDLKALDRQIRGRIASRIDALAENPHPQGTKKIVGGDELYLLRIGDYRILYQVKAKVLLVLIVGIGRRREVYRRIRG